MFLYIFLAVGEVVKIARLNCMILLSIKYVMSVICKEVDIEADACVHNCDTIRYEVEQLTIGTKN